MFLVSLSEQFKMVLPSSESIKSELNGRVKTDILRSFLTHLRRSQSTCGVMKCKQCGLFRQSFKCSRCRRVWYCSLNCETQHQSTHSNWCNPGRKLNLVYKNNAKQRNTRVTARVHVPCAPATKKPTTNVNVSIPTTHTDTCTHESIEIKENNDVADTSNHRKQSNRTNKLPQIRTVCVLQFHLELQPLYVMIHFLHVALTVSPCISTRFKGYQ
eukprot:36038_1